MKIGFIGAGRAGTSLGKYISESEQCRAKGIQVSGYSSLSETSAKWAADFTGTEYFADISAVLAASDTLVISTPDGAVMDVWESLNQYELRGKIVCHLSGSLSSDVFSNSEEVGAYAISVHPMFAFSDKESTYLKLHDAGFTLEGHPYAVKAWKAVFDVLGNDSVTIEKNVKKLYHCAASLLSNHVLAVLQTGYELLEQCGFTYEQAVAFSRSLVLGNAVNAAQKGCIASLTGPIDRNDYETVEGHLAALKDASGNDDTEKLYRICGKKLISLAEEKNPHADYSELKKLLQI